MEQIIKYQELKSIDDINKNVSLIPISVMVVKNQPKFTISNYNEFKELIINITREYRDEYIGITKSNVRNWENNASNINKLIKQIKKDSKDYIKLFTDELNKQVVEITDILQDKYDIIHSKTKAFRESLKPKNDVIDVVETTDINSVILQVVVDKSQVEDFKNYCLEHNIIVKE